MNKVKEKEKDFNRRTTSRRYDRFPILDRTPFRPLFLTMDRFKCIPCVGYTPKKASSYPTRKWLLHSKWNLSYDIFVSFPSFLSPSGEINRRTDTFFSVQYFQIPRELIIAIQLIGTIKISRISLVGGIVLPWYGEKVGRTVHLPLSCRERQQGWIR